MIPKDSSVNIFDSISPELAGAICATDIVLWEGLQSIDSMRAFTGTQAIHLCDKVDGALLNQLPMSVMIGITSAIGKETVAVIPPNHIIALRGKIAANTMQHLPIYCRDLIINGQTDLETLHEIRQDVALRLSAGVTGDQVQALARGRGVSRELIVTPLVDESAYRAIEESDIVYLCGSFCQEKIQAIKGRITLRNLDEFMHPGTLDNIPKGHTVYLEGHLSPAQWQAIPAGLNIVRMPDHGCNQQFGL